MRGFMWRVAGVALLAVQAGAGEKIFNVAELGAASDGQTLCTPALQRAVDTAGAAGGGTVRFPAGTYLSGSLQLRNVTLGGVAVQAPAEVLLQLDGEQTKRILLDKSNVQAVKKIMVAAPGVSVDAFLQKP